MTAAAPAAPRRRRHDAAIIALTAVVAGCGLVYEYLLAHAAGRVLGAAETVIYTMIGTMIVAMGAGAFAARWIRDSFAGFVWLEAALAALGAASVLIIGAVTALAVLLPETIAAAYGLPPDRLPTGSLVRTAEQAAAVAPYLLGAVLALLVGMEIPLLARIRETLHARRVAHNTGTIYGADYIGAGIGAALWVGLMLTLEPALSAVLTASVNVAAGTAFLLAYRRHVRHAGWLLGIHAAVAAGIAASAPHAVDWSHTLEDLLYHDRVVYSANTQHQRLTVTAHRVAPGEPPVHAFHLNGRLQFDAGDEHIYHAMLTYPAMLASARHDDLLVIGGGDGLAVRDLLRWNPRSVTVVDLDPELVAFFRDPRPDGANAPLLRLNRHAFRDPRVTVRHGDAFLDVENLIAERRRFDAIVVDLPDPSTPDLARLYSVRFYTRLRRLLAGDGALAIQSTSPYHAADAFLTVGVTAAAAGFAHVERYQATVPSFGPWGWTLAVPHGRPASVRIAAAPDPLPVDDGWTTKAMLEAAFAFPQHFLARAAALGPSQLGNAAVYVRHHDAWHRRHGVPAPAPPAAP